MKFWVLSLLVIASCSGALAWLVREKTIPGFLTTANGEMVADWHAGLSECRAETGLWPDVSDPVTFGARVFIVEGADGRRIPGGYMHGRPSRFQGGVVYDVYDQPMRFTISGDRLIVASAGANQLWGDADDVTSDSARERYKPSTLTQARAEAQARALKKK